MHNKNIVTIDSNYIYPAISTLVSCNSATFVADTGQRHWSRMQYHMWHTSTSFPEYIREYCFFFFLILSLVFVFGDRELLIKNTSPLLSRTRYIVYAIFLYMYVIINAYAIFRPSKCEHMFEKSNLTCAHTTICVVFIHSRTAEIGYVFLQQRTKKKQLSYFDGIQHNLIYYLSYYKKKNI